MNLTKFIAPRRQARKERFLLISPNLGAPSTSLRTCFASLHESGCFRFSCVKFRQNFQKCLARFLSNKSGKTVDVNRGIEFGILPANLARRWVNPDHETVSNELKRHIPGIPSLHKRNEKL